MALFISGQDLTNYNKNSSAIAKKYFNIPDIDDYYKKADPKPLIFCHFARGLAEKVYNEVPDFQSLYKTLMEVRCCSVTNNSPVVYQIRQHLSHITAWFWQASLNCLSAYTWQSELNAEIMIAQL